MELWFTEDQTPEMRISCRVKELLYSDKSEYQNIAIYDTEQFGRLLALDDIIQTNIMDEFVYHEMMAHVPLFTHKNPEKVVVIGGGDGGVIREIVKHPSVKKAILAEIDGKVVEACKKYLPEISCGLADPKAEICIGDGIKYVKDHKNEFDLVCVDSTDPIGPAVGLFAKEFYQSIFDSLKDDGIFVAQTESPFFNQELLTRVYNDIKAIFPITRVYYGMIPSYPGFWSFTMGSKKYDPLEVDITKISDMNTRYFTPEIFKAAFALPKFVKDILK